MVEIALVTEIMAPVERCFDLARSVEVHLLGTEGTGEAAVGGVRTGLGEFVRWRAKHLGVWQHLSSRITAFERPGYFQDTMVEGAFRSMVHDHFFREVGPGGRRCGMCFGLRLRCQGWVGGGADRAAAVYAGVSGKAECGVERGSGVYEVGEVFAGGIDSGGRAPLSGSGYGRPLWYRGGRFCR